MPGTFPEIPRSSALHNEHETRFHACAVDALRNTCGGLQCLPVSSNGYEAWNKKKQKTGWAKHFLAQLLKDARNSGIVPQDVPVPWPNPSHRISEADSDDLFKQ